MHLFNIVLDICIIKV